MPTPSKLPQEINGSKELRSVFSPTTRSADDSMALQEAVSIGSGVDIEADGKEREHNRHQNFRNHINTATIGIFWVVALSILIGIITFSWHTVTPESWHYLTQIQLDKLQTVLTSAVLSSALTGYVGRRMD